MGHSQIPDEALDVRVAEIKQFNPNYGSKVLAGYLAAQGIKISGERIRNSLRRVDPIGVNAPTHKQHWHHLPGYLKPLSLELKKATLGKSRTASASSLSTITVAGHTPIYHATALYCSAVSQTPEKISL